MRNSFKILMIIFVFIILSIPALQSFAINMNLDSNPIPDNNTEINTDINNTISDSDTDNTQSSNTFKTVTVTSTENDEFLTTENILSIIIIVIGILLIFLGIAILIRTK